MTDKVKQCLLHRYLYYVLSSPIISDYAYDMLEVEAKKEDTEGLISTVGSSLSKSYPKEIIELAETFMV
jgi:NAD-dependent DNA ligase